MKYFTLVMLLSTACMADDYAYIGKDVNGVIVEKHTVVNESDRERLSRFQVEKPALTWSRAKSGEREYDSIVPTPPTPREEYRAASTQAEKMAVIEKVLNLR